MDLKRFLKYKKLLLGGGVTAGLGLVGFSFIYSQDIENKLESYNQIQLTNTQLDTGIEKLVLLNGIGEVNIIESDNENVEVTSYIVYKDDIKEEQLKVNEVQLDVEKISEEDGLNTYVLTNMISDGTNYFTYINAKKYLRDVEINYDIEIPKSLKEIYVYNPIGNVKIYGAEASVRVVSYKGNIFAKNITPDDFISLQTYQGDIDISLKNSITTSYVGASAYYGDINFEVKDSTEYELGKDNPKVLAMENDVFKAKAYEKIKTEFLAQEKYENKKFKVSLLSRKGECLTNS